MLEKCLVVEIIGINMTQKNFYDEFIFLTGFEFLKQAEHVF